MEGSLLHCSVRGDVEMKSAPDVFLFFYPGAMSLLLTFKKALVSSLK